VVSEVPFTMAVGACAVEPGKGKCDAKVQHLVITSSAAAAQSMVVMFWAHRKGTHVLPTTRVAPDSPDKRSLVVSWPGQVDTLMYSRPWGMGVAGGGVVPEISRAGLDGGGKVVSAAPWNEAASAASRMPDLSLVASIMGKEAGPFELADESACVGGVATVADAALFRRTRGLQVCSKWCAYQQATMHPSSNCCQFAASSSLCSLHDGSGSAAAPAGTAAAVVVTTSTTTATTENTKPTKPTKRQPLAPSQLLPESIPAAGALASMSSVDRNALIARLELAYAAECGSTAATPSVAATCEAYRKQVAAAKAAVAAAAAADVGSTGPNVAATRTNTPGNRTANTTRSGIASTMPTTAGMGEAAGAQSAGGMGGGAIAGVVVAVVFAVGLVCAVAVVLVQRRQRSEADAPQRPAADRAGMAFSNTLFEGGMP